MRAEGKGKILCRSRSARFRFTEDLTELADRQIAIEAIVEDLEAKLALFGRLDEIIPRPDAVLASNTSSFPIITLAAATGRPERVVGLHFFNPVPVLSLVEVAPSLLTSTQTADRATIFVEQTLHKHAIRCQDRAGFMVNALLVPFILSAIRMLEAGVATAVETLVRMPVPVVVAVHGAIAGAGLGLALSGDLCVAGASSRFSTAYLAVGLSPDAGSLHCCPGPSACGARWSCC